LKRDRLKVEIHSFPLANATSSQTNSLDRLLKIVEKPQKADKGAKRAAKQALKEKTSQKIQFTPLVRIHIKR